MTELVREFRGLVEALNKTTPLTVAALSLVLAILVVWTIGGSQ